MGIVFDIQRFCLHDGQGLRTTVFLKGCPLRCRWCSNPESQRPGPEMLYNRARCMRCGACAEACPDRLLSRDDGGFAVMDRDACALCGACEAVCPRAAMFRKGRDMSVEEVVREALRDSAFYRNSDGGVTLSGGEPFVQADFAHALLAALREAGVHTAVETTAHVSPGVLARSLPFVDQVLVDIKHTDDAVHREWTGVGLDLIRPNIAAIARDHPNALLRIPVIPGFNTDDSAFAGFAAFAEELGVAVELLPYHTYGEGKYAMLGLAYPGAGIDAAGAADDAERLRQRLHDRGVAAEVHG